MDAETETRIKELEKQLKDFVKEAADNRNRLKLVAEALIQAGAHAADPRANQRVVAELGRRLKRSLE